MGAVLRTRMSLAGYLDWENAQPDKHEFVQGEVFAMTGGRRVHGRVLLNLASLFARHLEGTPCQVFADSMKLQVAEDTVLYPDLFVTCDPADLATEQIFRAPKLIVEVLSPSTQAYDRSKKFALYRRLASLQEYILVDPDSRRVDAFRRSLPDHWMLHDLSDGPEFEAACLGLRAPLEAVFWGMEPPVAPVAPVTTSPE